MRRKNDRKAPRYQKFHMKEKPRSRPRAWKPQFHGLTASSATRASLGPPGRLYVCNRRGVEAIHSSDRTRFAWPHTSALASPSAASGGSNLFHISTDE